MFETHWLLEKKDEKGVMGIYLHKEGNRTTRDAWEAMHFESSDAANKYAERESLAADGFVPIDHGFEDGKA
jgi:hypothetical protein